MTEQNNKTYLIGFILALSAGLIWSFGAPTVRYMVDAQVYQWHYLFYRGIVVATILLIYLIYNEGISFYHLCGYHIIYDWHTTIICRALCIYLSKRKNWHHNCNSVFCIFVWYLSNGL